MKYLPETDNIKFKYENSTNHYDIDIRIKLTKESPTLSIHAFLGYQNPVMNKSFKIPIQHFEELKKLIRILEEHDPQDNTTGLDGTSWHLEYMIDGKIKSYEFWNSESRTGTTDLTVFMNACKRILELAKVDINISMQ